MLDEAAVCKGCGSIGCRPSEGKFICSWGISSVYFALSSALTHTLGFLWASKLRTGEAQWFARQEVAIMEAIAGVEMIVVPNHLQYQLLNLQFQETV